MPGDFSLLSHVNLKIILESALYLLVLINPMSKIFILSVLSKECPKDEMRRLVVKSSWVALLILLALGVFGDFVLDVVFHIKLYSLKVAGGIVVFAVGFNALTKGVFFELDEKKIKQYEDMSIVPLASPMIAGPATIAAAISLHSEFGTAVAFSSILVAILANHLVMLLSSSVAEWMLRYNLMGALIRITGLIVASISVQMIFSGIGEWWMTLPK